MSITWILLLAAIGAIVLFLLWTSRRDRKKRKEIEAKKEKMKIEANESRGQIAIWVLEIKNIGNKVLKDFVPSIGKFKMGEIREGGKKAIEELKSSRNYKVLKIEESNNDLVEIIDDLQKEPINNWDSRMKKEFQIIEKESKVSGQEYEMFRKKVKDAITKTFKKVNSKMISGK